MPVIRDAVVHLINDQPLIADLFALPQSQDACIVCTNLRNMAGHRPAFVDRSDSVFLFPLQHVRFVEIPPDSAGDVVAAMRAEMPERGGEEPDLEIDEDLLRRIRET
jgi:hypothetical protein